MTRRERSKVKAMQEHTYIPIILCILAGIQTTNASLGLSCAVCSETHPELNITCTWDTQPGVSYSPFFKLQRGTSCASYTTWQVCSSSGEGTCQIPFLHCESSFDRFQVKVETSDSEAQTISFYKNEIAKPDPPEELTVHTDSSTQMTVGWKMPECTDMMFNSYTCQVEYTSQQNITRTSETSVDFDPEASKELQNLTPYTLYRVRVRCKPVLGALDGWGEFTNTVEAQTHAAAPSRGPHVLTPEDVWLDYRKGLRNVTIQWQALSTTDYNGVLQGYHIRVRDLRTDEVTELTVNNSGAQSYTHTLGNLKLSGYQVNITAYNAEGQSPPRTRFINDIARKPDPPRDLAAMASDNNLQLSWQPPADVGGIETYVILWCELVTDVTCAGPEKNRTVAGSELSIKVIDSWRPLTRYRFVVKAVNSAGQSEASNTAAGYTVQGVPSSPPQNVTVEAETSTSLLVSWKPPPLQDRRGIITKYRVYYYVTPTVSGQRMASDAVFLSVNVTDDALPVQFSLSGLEAFTDYSVRVSAVTSQGEGDKTDPVSTKTKQAAPSDAPSNVHVINATVNTMVISWTPPSQPNGIIQSYIVHYGNGSSVQVVNQRKVVLEGLEGDVEYPVQVQACTGALRNPCGPLSPVENFHTILGEPGIPKNLKASFDEYAERVHVVWDPPVPRNARYITYSVSYGREGDDQVFLKETTETEWLVDKSMISCKRGWSYFFWVQAQPVGQMDLAGNPTEIVYLDCNDIPNAYHSSQPEPVSLTAATVAGVIAVLVLFSICLAVSGPKLHKRLKEIKGQRSQLPGPKNYFSEEGTYYSVPGDSFFTGDSMQNPYVISDAGVDKETIDDISQLKKLGRQWSHDSAIGLDSSEGSIVVDVPGKSAQYSTASSSSGCSDGSEESLLPQKEEGDAEKADVVWEKRDRTASTNTTSSHGSSEQGSEVAEYSKVAAVGGKFRDLNINYVPKIGEKEKNEPEGDVPTSPKRQDLVDLDPSKLISVHSPVHLCPDQIKHRIIDPDKIVYIAKEPGRAEAEV